MKNEKLGNIIFSKILQMPLGKYLAFIERSIPQSGTNACEKK